MNNFIKISAILLLIQPFLYADWQKITSFPNSYVYDITFSGNTIYTASTDGVRKSTNSTATWELLNNGLSNAQAVQCSEIMVSGSNLYVSTVDGIYKSVDGGANWVKKSEGIFVGNGALYAFCKSIYEINGMLLTGAFTGIYRSTNGGENWIVTNITGQHVYANNFTLYNGILFAARETNNPPGSYKSTDNGVTWTAFSISGSYLPAITFYDDGPRLYSGTIDGVWLSTNNGLNWAVKNTGLSLDPYSSSILRVNGVLVTSLKFGGSGMFISNNNGDLWINFGQGLPFLSAIEKVVLNGTKLLAVTSSGIYERNISELTGITRVSTEIPQNFSLEQNYPNPFNPETKINFNIPLLREVDAEGGLGVLVKLIVYDITGSDVQTLVNESLQPGSYEASFDGKGLSSGMYFYTLTAGDYKSTKKMILVK